MASDTAKRKIGIFGGTFDPIHYGHLTIGQLALEVCQLDELYFVPAGNPPHKASQNVTEAIHRLTMVKMAVSSHSQFRVCDYEINRKNPSYSMHLLTSFREQFPEDELYLVMGADSFLELELWYHYQELFSLVHMVVMDREGSDTLSLEEKANHYKRDYQADITLITGICLDVSSSMLRQRVRNHLSLTHLTTENVVRYIDEEQLYQKQVKNRA